MLAAKAGQRKNDRLGGAGRQHMLTIGLLEKSENRRVWSSHKSAVHPSYVRPLRAQIRREVEWSGYIANQCTVAQMTCGNERKHGIGRRQDDVRSGQLPVDVGGDDQARF